MKAEVVFMVTRRQPGVVRDAIVDYMRGLRGGDASVAEIQTAVDEALGEAIPPSSVRSYLGENTPGRFQRTDRGRYRLARG